MRTNASVRTTPPRRRVCLAAVVLACVACAGCTVGPDFRAPQAPRGAIVRPTELVERTVATPQAGGEAQEFVVRTGSPGRWWSLYGSTRLDALVDQALRTSSTVAAAEAVLKQAEEDVVVQRAGLMPSASVGVTGTRQKVEGASTGQPQLGGIIYNLFNASLNLSYNLDVFGGVRRGIESQEAVQEAQRNRLLAVRETLAANVVTAAVLEASLRAQRRASQELIASARRQLELTRGQFELGGAPPSAVLTAQANLASFEAELPPLQQHLAIVRSQLAVYVDKPPGEFDEPPFDLEDLRLPREIPVLVPSDVLRQRPDVREAEARLHQASASIGVATASLFPEIGITGAFGGAAATLGSLLKAGAFGLSGSVSQPVFQGGALLARRRASIDAYDEAQARYRETVLTAFKGVADALHALDNDAQALSAQFRAQSAATEGLRLIEDRYREGSANQLELLTAQQQFHRARSGYVQATAARLADTAALFLALGGDWENGGEGGEQ